MTKTINFSVDITLLECEGLTVDLVKESIEKTTGIFLAFADKTVNAKIDLTRISEEA